MPTRGRPEHATLKTHRSSTSVTSDAGSVRSLKNRIAEAALADDAAGFRRALLEFQEQLGKPPEHPAADVVVR